MSRVRAGKRGNICVGNNVSATMCPRLPGPLVASLQPKNLTNRLKTVFFGENLAFKGYGLINCQAQAVRTFALEILYYTCVIKSFD